MKPAPGTRLRFVGTEGVLFSEPRQEVHAFNTSACVIWCHLEDGLTPEQIADRLVDESGLDWATACSHVDAALADWGAKALLAGGPVLPLASPPPERVIPDLPTPPADGFADERTYRMLGVIMRVRFARERHAGLVGPLFAHLECEDGLATDHIVDIAPADTGIGLYLDGAPAGFCASDEEIAPAAKGVAWTAVLRRQDYLLHIHAGVVGGPAGCVLLPAVPGGGKSTLTTALVHAGFELFSDEVALLAAADLTVSPFPTAICVKDSGIDLISEMYPIIRELPIHRRGDGKRTAYLPPPRGSVPGEGHQRKVCGIVFPRYRAGASLHLRRLGAAEALSRLLAHCLNVGRTLDHGSIQRLIGWIESLPCFESEYDALPPICNFIGTMLRGSS
jgi:hypothetical protein